MLLFFIGFLFIFLDFPVTIGQATINFIPDFVGYIFLLFGCHTIGKESNHFIPVRIVSFILALWGVANFVLSLIAFEFNTYVNMIVNIVVALGALYLTYEFTEGVKEYELAIGKPIGAAQLSSAWILLCMGNLIFYFSFFFEALTLICILLQLLSLIWFEYAVFSIWRTQKKMKL